MVYVFLLTALVGFERTMYDVSEHDTAKVCVGVLSGRLSEDAVIQVSSSRGTASESIVFCH